MGYFVIIMLTLALLFAITRPFTVLFHELGHAIPAILMTRKSVSIYIGSFGDPNKSLHFSIGLLDVWFKYNPFTWRQGLCVPSAEEISINRKIVYTLTGPLASVVIAVVGCYLAFALDLHGSLKLLLVFFVGSSIFDLFVDLIPIETPMVLYDGRLTYNDGYQLRRLLAWKRFAGKYELAAELYTRQQYDKAADSFCEMLEGGLKVDHIYRLAINSLLQTKSFARAKELSDEFMLHGDLDSGDYAAAGVACSHLGQKDKAVEWYDKSLALDPNNYCSLCNKGFSLILFNQFEEAIPLFDKAIEIDNTSAHSYSSRGLAKIKIGRVEEGLEDITHSFKLDGHNSYAYRSLGIYHLDKGDAEHALNLFKKAKELDDTTYLIDELINEADSQERKRINQ
ncbi:M50 family metallopeptidase [Paraflavitalea sp. CAU 1676]|uniref:M50 family metallopeptidase n=1 Tax=Paraflavitalea sp. CAU 1676 TaxID=3032598 RepID=UPI0023DB34E1|nr:M50 family metallopeptidase [Paraflavitalea sp. CAU 1676]MDF2191500.1 M50 family metallopeptidase [Paraflavitalea sp. CAU 1676]